jgi:OOP family OmpA-OmpF porin
VLDPNDKCPKEPETKNGYEDDDGCPDEVPEAVKKFTGVIEGIEFDTGKATIRKKSTEKLDAALKVLTDYPKLKIEISGHTDNVGKDEANLKLSQDRADSVKKYFTDKGIDAARIQTRGAGPSQPIEDNKTAAGRQKNRRIEFKLVQ